MKREAAFNLTGRGSRAHQIYDWLRGAILSGELRPDERLVEETIARRARVSRTPVREALQRLEMDGLVRITGRGVMVTAYSDDELYDLCVAREGMEGLVARLAANSRTDFDLLTFEHIMEETREATQAEDYELLGGAEPWVPWYGLDRRQEPLPGGAAGAAAGPDRSAAADHAQLRQSALPGPG